MAELRTWALTITLMLVSMALHPPLWLLVPQLIVLAWALIGLSATAAELLRRVDWRVARLVVLIVAYTLVNLALRVTVATLTILVRTDLSDRHAGNRFRWRDRHYGS